jgi:hypothetical protein
MKTRDLSRLPEKLLGCRDLWSSGGSLVHRFFRGIQGGASDGTKVLAHKSTQAPGTCGYLATS